MRHKANKLQITNESYLIPQVFFLNNTEIKSRANRDICSRFLLLIKLKAALHSHCMATIDSFISQKKHPRWRWNSKWNIPEISIKSHEKWALNLRATNLLNGVSCCVWPCSEDEAGAGVHNQLIWSMFSDLNSWKGLSSAFSYVSLM